MVHLPRRDREMRILLYILGWSWNGSYNRASRGICLRERRNRAKAEFPHPREQLQGPGFVSTRTVMRPSRRSPGVPRASGCPASTPLASRSSSKTVCPVCISSVGGASQRPEEKRKAGALGNLVGLAPAGTKAWGRGVFTDLDMPGVDAPGRDPKGATKQAGMGSLAWDHRCAGSGGLRT